MSTALITLGKKLADRFGMGCSGEEVVTVLKATAFKGPATDAQLTALMIVADQYGLNPFTKELFAFPDKNNGIVPVVSVDGWSRIINHNPQLDGIEFVYSDALVRPDGARCDAHEWIECIIYRKDRSKPTVAREYLDEVYRAPFKKDNGYQIDGPWQTHPKRFHRHKTVIQCARLAFGFGGIFDQDEAERIVEKDMGAAEVVAPKPIDPPTKEKLADARLESAIAKIKAGEYSTRKLFDNFDLSESQLDRLVESGVVDAISGEVAAEAAQ